MPNNKLNRHEIINLLNHLENNYPVTKWEIKHIKVWPLIREKLYFYLVKSNENLNIDIHTSEVQTKNLFKITINALFEFFILFKIRNYDSVCISKGCYYEMHNGVIYHRFFDPLTKRYPQKKFVFIKTDNQKNECHTIKSFNAGYLIVLISKLASVIAKFNSNRSFRNFKNVEEQILLIAPDYNTSKIDFSVIKRQVITILLFSRIFQLLLLGKTKLKRFFQVCYYDQFLMGANIYAKKKGILSYEIQHGQISESHGMFAKWRNVPLYGYNLMPNIFLCWTKQNMHTLSDWLTNIKNSKSVCFGHPFAIFTEVKKVNNQKNKCNRPKILFTLQPLGEILDKTVIDLIHQTTEEFEWFFRLHPKQLPYRKEVEEYLKEIDIYNKIKIDDPIKNSLLSSLAQTDIHITYYSGSVIEAELLGIKSILLDKRGIETFKNQIDNGNAIPIISNNTQDIINSIKSITT